MLGLVFAGVVHSAWTPKEQFNSSTRETQKAGNCAGRLTVAWWMPPEFWKITLLASGDVPVDKIDQSVASIEDVNVFLIIDGRIGGFGAIDYTVPSDLQKNLSVVDPQGQPMALIPEGKQSTSVKNLIATMGPVFTNMLGDVGKHMSFLVFEGRSKNGARRVDPTKPGVLTARFGGEDFRWRLPLGSLSLPKICPKCSETLPGNYAFCPFDATPLTEQAGQKK